MARRCCVGRGCAALAVTLAAVFSVFPLYAGQPPADPMLRAQLESGEFAPALARAKQLPDLPQRDAVLAQIAVAQAQAGAQSASIQTASMIASDQARASASTWSAATR